MSGMTRLYYGDMIYTGRYEPYGIGFHIDESTGEISFDAQHGMTTDKKGAPTGKNPIEDKKFFAKLVSDYSDACADELIRQTEVRTANRIKALQNEIENLKVDEFMARERIISHSLSNHQYVFNSLGLN